MNRLLRCACYLVVIPLSGLALVGALAAFLLGAMIALVIDCFNSGRSYNGR